MYYELGQTFEENGEVENALEAFNRVKELRGGNASTEFQSKVQKLKEQIGGS
jgi:hypothetical protein